MRRKTRMGDMRMKGKDEDEVEDDVNMETGSTGKMEIKILRPCQGIGRLVPPLPISFERASTISA